MSEQLTYAEALEELRGAYEREKIQLTARISTLEVALSQQSIHITKLEKELSGKESDCNV